MRRGPGPRRGAGRADPGRALRALRRELRDDAADRDVTTRALGLDGRRGGADVRAQGRGVVSGVAVAARLARSCGLAVRIRVRDGQRVVPGDPVLHLSGPWPVILGIERTLLNLLMHLSGVATATAEAVAAVRAAGGGVEVYATRKTLPGLRDLEKAAVVDGGGRPHRRDLSDGFLLKTSHTGLVPLPEALVRLRRAAGPRALVEAEVRDLAEARTAVRSGADAILLDNLPPAAAGRIVRALARDGLRERVWIELSGGIDRSNIARFARTGADAVSLGSLTHSARALPFHLVRAPRAPRGE